jgi:hypothetical protein
MTDNGQHDLACGRYRNHPDPLCAECQKIEHDKRVRAILSPRMRGRNRRAALDAAKGTP